MKKKRFINRELSWLEFNQRILELACDPDIPLLERLKFLCITSTNLDEFFMVRVGGLQILEAQGNRKPDPSGLTPTEQLDAIERRVHEMVSLQQVCLQSLENLLHEEGIHRVRPDDLSQEQFDFVQHLFNSQVFPVLSPMAVPSTAEFPIIAGRSLYMGVRLKPAGKEGERHRFAIIPLGKQLGRLLAIPGLSGYSFIMLEDVVALYIDRFFSGETVAECAPFRITRNADLIVREDMASDLLSEMEAVLEARKNSDCIRLEIDNGASNSLTGFLQRSLRIQKEAIYRFVVPLDISGFMRLADLPGYKSLKNDPWPSQAAPQLEAGANIFDILRKQTVMLIHPYQTFEPVVRLVEQASADPDVVAIKQILYRTSRNSPIVAALIRAARSGKYVTAVVELKARFDEERNIEWAKELEKDGVQVIYGVKGLKTHAKVCMAVRREADGMHRYLHIGTGNYNEITALLYSDVSYMTCDDELGADASAFFNAITGYSQPQQFHRIAVAPIGLREQILDLIKAETERKKQGQKAFVNAKMNSLVDPDIIDALYDASIAGVKIRLNVRGICCLAPGIAGLSENISVISIVDRYLEHSRIFHFCNGGEEKIFISTADWMPRNLDKRVELLVPIDDQESKDRLIDMLNACFKDTASAWRLEMDGTFRRIQTSGRKRGFRSQEYLYGRASGMLQQTRRKRRTAFEPHIPPSGSSIR
jgi:polyphosphate kinase